MAFNVKRYVGLSNKLNEVPRPKSDNYEKIRHLSDMKPKPVKVKLSGQSMKTKLTNKNKPGKPRGRKISLKRYK